MDESSSPALTPSRSSRSLAGPAIVLVLVSGVGVAIAIGLARGEHRSLDDVPGTRERARVESGVSFFSEQWMRDEGIPVYEEWAVDVDRLELAPWRRLGARGAYIRLHGQQGLTNSYALEIAPGTHTIAERHVFDEYLYVMRGHGRTRFWRKSGDTPAEVEWGPGSLISPPLNAWHEHANEGSEPALLVGLTNAPPIVDFYRDPKFVFDNPARFDERWDGNADFFRELPRPRGPGEPFADPDHPMVANFIPDVLALGDVMFHATTKRGWFVCFSMCGNTLNPHVSTWEEAHYQAAHRHGPGATVLIVRGEGFALMWPSVAGTKPWQDGRAASVVRAEFHPGTLYSPPDDWYHTHVNLGPGDATYLAVTPKGRDFRVQFDEEPGHNPVVEKAEKRTGKSLPIVIRADAEDPAMRKLLQDALDARGVHERAQPISEP